MKKRIYQSLLFAVMFLPMYYYTAQATGPDTLWTRDFWRELNASVPDYFEFHPTNDSIFIFTSIGKDSNGISTKSETVHFVNTITGQVFKKYAPIHEAHYTPDGNFIIGHNDSTIVYISLDSMKPVRTYPVLNAKIAHYTIDEKGKYVYTTMYFPDSSKTPFAFFRWDIANGTVQRVDLPDTLLDINVSGCPINNIVIEDMLVSDTAKILLMQISVERPKPHCPAETRVWGIDLNADTLKYDFTKLHPTYTMSILDKIMPKRTQFIGNGWKYENNIDSSYYYIFDIATGAKVKEMLKGSYDDYAISKDESFVLTSDIVVYPNIQLNVFGFDNFDTVYIYNDVYTGPLAISPNNEFILQDASTLFVLYSTPWFPTSVIKPKDDTPETLVYPNPAADYIEIIVPRWRGIKGVDSFSPSEKRGEHHSAMFTGGVSIFDVLGVEVNNSTLTPTLSLKGEGVRIDISHLAPGIYFVRFGDMVKKFVKM